MEYILAGLLVLFIILRLVDPRLLFAPLWHDLVNFRLRYWFGSRKPRFSISRPDVLLGKNSKTGEDQPHIHEAQVRIFDLDLMGHMNNARYLREADLARFEFLHDSGLFHAAYFRSCPWVTAAQTIRYRRELNYAVQYQIETRALGWDAKAIYIQHLFKHQRTGDVHAILVVREAMAVPRKIKESNPQLESEPVKVALMDWLEWGKAGVPATKEPPKDVADWANSLHEQYSRVIPPQHHATSSPPHVHRRHQAS